MDFDRLDDTTPSEPSQKLIRTLRRSVDAIVKVNHRISNRAQRSLNQQTAKALVAVGGLRDLLAMVNIPINKKKYQPKY